MLPAVRALGRPVVASVGGFAPGEYVDLVRVLDGADGVVALELNVSCPNVALRLHLDRHGRRRDAGSRGRLPRRLSPAAVGQAASGRTRHRRRRAGGTGRRRRRSRTHQHAARGRDRPPHRPSAAGRSHRRAERAGAAARRPGLRARLSRGDEPPDRGSGRDHDPGTTRWGSSRREHAPFRSARRSSPILAQLAGCARNSRPSTPRRHPRSVLELCPTLDTGSSVFRANPHTSSAGCGCLRPPRARTIAEW